MVSRRALQFMRFSAAVVLPLCQENSHDSFLNDDWRQITKRGNFNQRKSWHVIRKRNQHSFWSIVPGEVLKNSHIFFFFFTQRLCKKLLKYCLNHRPSKRPVAFVWWLKTQRYWKADVARWEQTGCNEIKCSCQVSLLIEIKHWKGILWYL